VESRLFSIEYFGSRQPRRLLHTNSSRENADLVTPVPTSRGSTFVAPLVDALSGRPTSVAISGLNRVLLTRVAVGLAHRIDTDFRWFDIRRSGSESPPWQLALEADISPERLHRIDVPEMHLDSAGRDRESSELVYRPPAPESPGLIDYLSRIPDSIRTAALEGDSARAPRVILITNAERASAAFDATAGTLRPYIEALNRVGVTIVLTACSRPRENRHDLDMVLQVDGATDDANVAGSVICEETRSAGLFPTIPPGSSYASDSIARV